MKKIVSNIILASLLSLSGSAIAADAAAGKTVAARCIACHGMNGEGNAAMVAPKLAGQHEVYLVSALKAYKNGARNNPLMSPMAKPLTDDDIANVAAHYANIK